MKVDDISLERAQNIVDQVNAMWPSVTVEILEKVLAGLDVLREQVLLELEERRKKAADEPR